MSSYGVEDLAEIVRRAAARDGFEIASEAAWILAKAAAGTARTAISLYVRTRTFVEAQGRGSATSDDARHALRLAQLDENGIGPVHRRILEVLRKHGRPLALRRLVEQVGITVEAFRSIYEPALFNSGAIIATPGNAVDRWLSRLRAISGRRAEGLAGLDEAAAGEGAVVDAGEDGVLGLDALAELGVIGGGAVEDRLEAEEVVDVASEAHLGVVRRGLVA